MAKIPAQDARASVQAANAIVFTTICCDVVVDGRTLSWEELGMALESYEGWNFRLVIEDRIHDARGDAEVVELPRRRGGGG